MENQCAERDLTQYVGGMEKGAKLPCKGRGDGFCKRMGEAEGQNCLAQKEEGMDFGGGGIKQSNLLLLLHKSQLFFVSVSAPYKFNSVLNFNLHLYSSIITYLTQPVEVLNVMRRNRVISFHSITLCSEPLVAECGIYPGWKPRSASFVCIYV